MGRKKLNKIIMSAVIGSAVLGVGGLSTTKKGRKINKKIFGKARSLTMFLNDGLKELTSSLLPKNK